MLGVSLGVAASDVFVPWAVNLLNGHTILIKVIEKVGECIFYSKNAGAFGVTPSANFPKSLLGHLTKPGRFYRPQPSCGKVMFSQASVILFTGGGVHGGGGHAWWGGGACQGGRACQGDMCGGCVAGGCAWQGGGQGCAWQEAGQTATAADGTHPTGMHSCLYQSLGVIFSNVLSNPILIFSESDNKLLHANVTRCNNMT